MKLCYILLFVFIVKIYSCGSGETDINGKCYTTANIANCKIVNPNHDSCYQCNDGYVFNTNHYCVAEIAHCSAYANDGKCSTCEHGYTESSGGACTCSGTEGDGICKIATNCVSYNSDGTCTKCAKGYGLNTGTGACSACSASQVSDGVSACVSGTLPTNCRYHDGTDCLECDEGYYLKFSAGPPVTYTCEQCSAETLVIQGKYCFTKSGSCYGYKPSDGTCGVAAEVPGCAEYDGNGCTKCKDFLSGTSTPCNTPCYYPNYVNGLTCTTNGIIHCKTHKTFADSVTLCTECDDGYELNSLRTSCVLKCPTCDTNNPKGSTEASNANSMKLNIIFMAIIMMFIA